MRFGIGYAPHMFGSGPRSWYTHRRGIALKERDAPLAFPFDALRFNMNDDIVPMWPTEAFRRRVRADLDIMQAMGLTLVRLHVVPTEPAYLDLLDWLADEAAARRLGLHVDLVAERPENWSEVDPDGAGRFAARLKGRVETWQLCNEVNLWRKELDIRRFALVFKEAAERIRRADPDASIALNNAGFDIDFTEQMLKEGVRFDLLGVDYYFTDAADPAVERQIDNLGRFRKAHPQIALSIAEFGLHPKPPVRYDSARLEAIAADFDSCGRRLLAGCDFVESFIPFWFQDLLVFKARCYHQVVHLDRSPTPLGRKYAAIIGKPPVERSHGPLPLDFDPSAPVLEEVRFEPSTEAVGAALAGLVRRNLLILGLDGSLGAEGYECGMMLAKCLAFYREGFPEVRTGSGDVSFALDPAAGPREGAIRVVPDGVALSAGDEEGLIAATMSLIVKFWRAEGFFSPEFALV